MFDDYEWYPVEEYMKAYDYKTGWPFVMLSCGYGVPDIARWKPKQPDTYDPWFATTEPGLPAGWYDKMERPSYILQPKCFMTITRFI